MGMQGVRQTAHSVGQSELIQNMRLGASRGADGARDLMINSSRFNRGMSHFAYFDTSDEILERRRRSAELEERMKQRYMERNGLTSQRDDHLFGLPGDNEYTQRERKFSDG